MAQGSNALVHIGTGKTGTTSLQAFLALNSGELEARGLDYSSFLKTRNQIQLALPFTDRIRARHVGDIGVETEADRQAFLTRLNREFKENVRPGARMVFTSEHLWRRLRKPHEVGKFADFMQRYFDSVQIVMYVRRQDYFLPSWFSTITSTGSTRNWDADYYLGRREVLNFLAAADRWIDVFGADQVTVRPYLERYKKAPTAVVQDFLGVAGVARSGAWRYPELENTRVSAEAIAVLRHVLPNVPPVINGKSNRPARLAMVQAVAKECSGPGLGIPSYAAEEILTRRKDANEEMASRFGDPDLWREWLDQPLVSGGVEQLPEISQDRLAQIYYNVASGPYADDIFHTGPAWRTGAKQAARRLRQRFR